MERPQTSEGPAAQTVEYIGGWAVRLDDLSLTELERLHTGCVARLKRARFELAVVKDVLEERRDPEDDMGLTL